MDFIIDGEGAWFVLPPFGERVRPEPGLLLAYRGSEQYLPASRFPVVERTPESLTVLDQSNGNHLTFDLTRIAVADVTEDDGFVVVEGAGRRLMMRNAPLPSSVWAD